MTEHEPTPDAPGTSSAEAPTVPNAPDAATEAPTAQAVPSNAEPAVASGASTAAAPPHQGGAGRGWIWGGVAVVAAVALVVGAYFVGRSSVDQGPASLSEAAQQTAKGELPVGDLSLSELGEALGGSKGDILSSLGDLGGKKGSGDSIVESLLDVLGDKLSEGLSGSDSSGSSSSSKGADAFFGVSTTNSSNPSGAQISAVRADSPAADAGLQAGDVITAVDGNAVASSSSLARQVATHSPGDVVSVTYTRDGNSATARVRLGNTTAATTTTSPAI